MGILVARHCPGSQPDGTGRRYSRVPLLICTLSHHQLLRRSPSFLHIITCAVMVRTCLLSPSGEGPCLPNSPELAWGPCWLENPACGHSPYLVERWWRPQPPSPFSAELEPPWSLGASMGSLSLPTIPGPCLCPWCSLLESHPPTSVCWLTPYSLFGFQLSYHHLLVIYPASLAPASCVHDAPCIPHLGLDGAVPSCADHGLWCTEKAIALTEDMNGRMDG